MSAAGLPFRLIIVTDWSLGRAPLLDRLDAALSCGAGIAVQHRHPGATARTFWEEGLTVRDLCRTHRAPLFVNSRLDVALGLEAHLHLTSTSLLPRDVRARLPPGRLVSVAVHDAEEARRAEGADLALVSPVFSPSSKVDDSRPPLGAAGFATLAGQLSCPAFALGGVDAARVHSLDCAGAAVISAVLRVVDPKAATRALLHRWSLE